MTAAWEFAALWVAWVVAGGSPGPATLGIAATSMGQGRNAGLRFALGVLASSAFWGVAAAAGMSAVMVANAWVFELIKIVGALYLLYLAFKSLKSAYSGSALHVQPSASPGDKTHFIRGTLIHLTNPKAILSWGAIYALVLPADAGVWAVFGLFAFLYSGSILIFTGYALLFSSSRVVV